MKKNDYNARFEPTGDLDKDVNGKAKPYVAPTLWKLGGLSTLVRGDSGAIDDVGTPGTTDDLDS